VNQALVAENHIHFGSRLKYSKERTKADAQFREAQKPQPAALPTTEAGRAKADYVAAAHAERAKTVRLKALRQTKEAADKVAKKPGRKGGHG
jgi:uncharacterized protein involved in type VI secretion and phage assembly